MDSDNRTRKEHLTESVALRNRLERAERKLAAITNTDTDVPDACGTEGNPAFTRKEAFPGTPVSSRVVYNLTQKMRIDEIMASERLARAIIEQAGDAIIVCDKEGRINQANRLAHQLCGNSPLLEPFHKLFRLRIEETGELFSVLPLMSGVCFEKSVVEFRRSDDRVFYLLLKSMPLRDGLNRIIGCVVTLTDITERRRAELKLHEIAELNSKMLHSLPANIAVIDRHGSIIAVNNRWTEFARKNDAADSFTTTVGANYIEVCRRAAATNDVEAVQALAGIEALLSGTIEKFTMEYSCHSPQQKRWFTLTAIPLGFCCEGGMTITHFDITARKQEETNQNLLADILRLFNRGGDLRMLIAETLRLIKHATGCDAVGLRLREGEDYPYYEQNGFSEEFLRKENFLCECRGDGSLTRDAAGRAVLECTCGLVLSGRTDPGMACFTDGGSFWVNHSDELLALPSEADPRTNPRNYCIHSGYHSIALFPVHAGEEIIGVLHLSDRREGRFTPELVSFYENLAQNIGLALQRTAAEEALNRLNEELEERIAMRTAELHAKDRILLMQSRHAAMGEMIGNIAHQWRQPLNTLGLTVQTLLHYYARGELDKDRLDKCVERSMKLIQFMSQTIDDFRNYFRPDKKKTEFEVLKAIADALTLVQCSFDKNQIAVKIVAKDNPVIYGYRNEFVHVLINILNNARDALMERRGSEPRVIITVTTESDRNVVTVADNAGGIPEEIMDRIFDPYFTTKGHQAGTGIGLFMSKSIMENNMGGMLTSRNNSDGAEFRIEI